MEVAQVAQPLVLTIAEAILRTTTTSTVAVPAVPKLVPTMMAAIPRPTTTSTAAVWDPLLLVQTMGVERQRLITMLMVVASVPVTIGNTDVHL